MICAWVPASILVIFSFIGLLGGVASIFSIPINDSLAVILPSAGGILGYLALTSLSFGFRLTLFTRLMFLLAGTLSLFWVYWQGINYQGELLDLGMSWFEIFLFGGPFLFGVIHILLHLLWLRAEVKLKS